MTALDEVLARITAEVRPRLDLGVRDTDAHGKPGYFCISCEHSSQVEIIDDIEQIIRDVQENP